MSNRVKERFKNVIQNVVNEQMLHSDKVILEKITSSGLYDLISYKDVDVLSLPSPLEYLKHNEDKSEIMEGFREFDTIVPGFLKLFKEGDFPEIMNHIMGSFKHIAGLLEKCPSEKNLAMATFLKKEIPDLLATDQWVDYLCVWYYILKKELGWFEVTGEITFDKIRKDLGIGTFEVSQAVQTRSGSGYREDINGNLVSEEQLAFERYDREIEDPGGGDQVSAPEASRNDRSLSDRRLSVGMVEIELTQLDNEYPSGRLSSNNMEQSSMIFQKTVPPNRKYSSLAEVIPGRSNYHLNLVSITGSKMSGSFELYVEPSAPIIGGSCIAYGNLREFVGSEENTRKYFSNSFSAMAGQRILLYIDSIDCLDQNRSSIFIRLKEEITE